MVVLGISETHCATAAVLRDGAIVGCASEERFSRLKYDAGYPRLAIDALLRDLALSPSAIDRVVLAGTRIPSYDWMNRVMRDAAYTREYYAVRLDAPRRGLTGRARKLGAKLGLLDPAPGKAPLPEGPRRFAWCSTSRTGDPAGSSGGSRARSTGPSSRRRSASGSTGSRAAPSGSSRNPSWPGRGACASATAASAWPSAAASS